MQDIGNLHIFGQKFQGFATVFALSHNNVWSVIEIRGLFIPDISSACALTVIPAVRRVINWAKEGKFASFPITSKTYLRIP